MSNLTVKVSEGYIEGRELKGTRAFLGVPYAQPPVGELRFRRPMPKKEWQGVRSCRFYAPQAFQMDLSGMPLYGKEFYSGEMPPMSEDCLYLNVWTPLDAKEGDRLPVFVYIHGGAFDHGTGAEVEFSGEGFAKQGIVCVTINYRVGALGFFAHDELETDGIPSGNYGLWDQLAAIKWIKKNATAFGGNPDNITVAGQSAGCMSAQALCCSEYADGVIDKAILQSAGGLPGLARDYSMESQKEKSVQLMKFLGVSTVKELYDLSPESIANAGLKMNEKGMSWLPVIDGDLLKYSVENITRSGKILNIPYIIGSTKDEMGPEIAKLMHDSVIGFAKKMNELPDRQPVYTYLFTHDLPGDDAGSFHSSELWYEFATLGECWRPMTEEDYDISRRMNGSFARFMRTGSPNGENLPEWKAYTTDDDTMIF